MVARHQHGYWHETRGLLRAVAWNDRDDGSVKVDCYVPVGADGYPDGLMLCSFRNGDGDIKAAIDEAFTQGAVELWRKR
jgi:hypothetical protein